MFDSYIKREGKKSLSVNQDKLGNARFQILIVLIWNARPHSVYKERDGSNHDKGNLLFRLKSDRFLQPQPFTYIF